MMSTIMRMITVMAINNGGGDDDDDDDGFFEGILDLTFISFCCTEPPCAH